MMRRLIAADVMAAPVNTYAQTFAESPSAAQPDGGRG